jgi:hypothetical protein
VNEAYGMQLTKGNINEVYSHLNAAGLSLWYQMTNKPDFYQTFEALTRVRQQFVEEFFLKTVAYQAYNYMFKNKDVVTGSILKFLNNETMANSIYSDAIFGMDSSQKLFYWFGAYRGNKTSF